MKKYILFLLLVFCTTLFAQKTSTYSKDEIDLKLELQQKEIETKIKESSFSSGKAICKIENQNALIAKQDKRIEDVRDNLYLSVTIMGIIIAVIGIAAALFGYIIDRNNRLRVQDAEKEIDKLKETTKAQIENIQRQAKLEVDVAKLEIQKEISKIISLKEKAEVDASVINDKKCEVEKKVQELTYTISQNKELGANKELNEDVSKTVEQLNTIKRETEFTAVDWFLKAYNADEKGEFENACVFYQKATEIKPNYADAYNNWGNTLLDLARLKKDESLFKKSFNKYQKATEIKPNYAMAYNNWGSALIGLAQLKNSLIKDKIEIEEKLLKAEKLEEGRGAYNLACLYSSLNEIEEAFVWFEKALNKEKNPTTRKHIERDADLDNIRQDPRFNELLDKFRPKKNKE